MKKNFRMKVGILVWIIAIGFVFFPACARKQKPVVSPEIVSLEEDTHPEVSDVEGDTGEAEAYELQQKQMMERDVFSQKDIYFDFDKSEITLSAQKILAHKIKWLKENDHIHFLIEGHCDERGTSQYNMQLGQKRASSTKQFLMSNGISESRISIMSHGKENPIELGSNEIAWAKNRRAHFVIQ